MLVCPITKQNLRPLIGDKAEQLYKAQAQNVLFYADGESVTANPEQLTFWVSENNKQVYSVIKGVPVLLEAKRVMVR